MMMMMTTTTMMMIEMMVTVVSLAHLWQVVMAVLEELISGMQMRPMTASKK
jgi:hypothetical protein